jgi:hypothetical protein
MERTIITAADLGCQNGGRAGVVAHAQPEPDNYAARLVKHVPSEIISVYLALEVSLRTIEGAPERYPLLWVTFGLLLLMTPFYLRRVARVQKWQQIALSTGAFVVWVLSLGSPFTVFAWYDPAIGAILLPLYTLFLAIAQPRA